MIMITLCRYIYICVVTDSLQRVTDLYSTTGSTVNYYTTVKGKLHIKR